MRYLSVCSGIEAASVAWQPLGWTPVAFAEIDPFACEVLAHYWPDVPNLGDLTQITEAQIVELGRIDLVIGGTPCQDISVAGLRAGIGGTRSRLFFDFVRVFHAARTLCGARWLLWENVPGSRSSNRGRDFARVVATLAGIEEFRPPPDGWGNEGLALGPYGLVEWCELDAQWFGLAQRRERVFALLDSGDWAARDPVLLEPEGLRGDYPPSREAGARAAGTLTPSSLGDSSPCGGDGREGLLISQPFDVANTLTARMHKGVNSTVDEGQTPIIIACFDETQLTHPENRSTCSADTAALARAARPPSLALASGASISVRRLTPTECERLQGFPDGFTAIRRRNGKPASDSARYAALGNSIATPVLRWIGEKLDAIPRE